MKLALALLLATLAAHAATPTDNDSFLAAIRAEPADDTIRLAYADFLDERGQPERAAFIRYQVTGFRLPNGAEKESLRKKADVLLKKHQPEWLPKGLYAALQSARKPIDWIRGFPAHIDLSDKLLADPQTVKAIAELPILPSVGIRFGERLTPITFLEATALTPFRRVPRIHFSGTLSARLLGDVLVRFPNARHLDFGLAGPMETSHVRAIIESAIAPKLESLSISEGGFSPQDNHHAFRTLANSPQLRSLGSLELANRAGPLNVLTDAVGLPALEELFLRHNDSFTADDLTRFVESPKFSRLHSLALFPTGPQGRAAQAHIVPLLEGREHALSKLWLDVILVTAASHPKLGAQIEANRAKTPNLCLRFAQIASELNGGVD